ncbi:MAG: hypothetical protein Alpg2KO_06950 [Alphaproteobacteria bacterium]
MEKQENPAQVAAMRVAAGLPRALMGGTAGMRAAGRTFLPQHPAEADAHYRARLSRAVLRNFFGRTVEVVCGKLFADDLEIGDDVSEALRGLFSDADLTGRSISQVARQVFEAALVDGMAAVLVEYPRLPEARSLAEEREMGGRPYLVPLTLDQIVGVRWGQRHWVPVLEQLRIRQVVDQPDGEFGAAEVEEIRVIEPDRWQVYRADDRGRWTLAENGVNPLGVVPVVPVYAGRTGLFEARSPLRDLAWMNLEHWQIRSDQRNALNVASFPILAASGCT